MRLNFTTRSIITPPAEYCDDHVCLSVCLSVCQPNLRNYTSDLHHLCACYLWQSLGPSLAALRYVMYFRFTDDVILTHKPRQLNVTAQLMEAQPTCSLGLGYKRRVGIPVAGQWAHTHGPTSRAPRSRPRPQWAC